MLKKEEVLSNNPFLKKISYLEDGREIGYLRYLLIYDRIEIENIEVLEQYRGNGIGTKMLAYLVSIAIDEKVINITLEVRINNKIAINLYKKFGFREVAKRAFYYGDEDGILMEKQVM